MQILIQIIIFLVTVLVLVTVHEFGHFWVARRLGVKVLRFSIGFGKALWRYVAKDGTEYVIAWLPLGGYVRLLDERESEVPEEDKHRAFNRKSLLTKTAIVIAGPFINILFGLLAFWLMFMLGVQQVKPIIGEVIPNSIAAESGLKANMEVVGIDGRLVHSWQKIMLSLIRRLGDHNTLTVTAKSASADATVNNYKLDLTKWSVDGLNPDPLTSLGIKPYQPPIPPVIAKVLPNSPAAQAGLQVADKVLAVNNQPTDDWLTFVHYVQDHPQQRLNLTIKRQQQVLSINVITGEQKVGWKSVGYLGIETAAVTWPKAMIVDLHYSPLQALQVASNEVWSFTTFNFIVLGKMLVGKVSLQSIGGPITIFRSAGEAFKQGLIIYIGFLGLISLMLAFVNILPIPGLDGGHLLLFGIEAVMRRPLSLETQSLIVRLGLILLVVIIVQATINDLMRLF